MRRPFWFVMAIAIGITPSLAHSQTARAFHFIGMIDSGEQVGFVDTSDLKRKDSLVSYSQVWVYTPPVLAGHSVVAYVVRHDEDDCVAGVRRQVSSELYDSRGDLLKMAPNGFPASKVAGGISEASHKFVCSKEARDADPAILSLKDAIAFAGQLSNAAHPKVPAPPEANAPHSGAPNSVGGHG